MNEWRILVVDDDADLGQLVADELTNARTRCEIASSGEAALAACARAAFDVVVADVRMDGMDGHELLARLSRLSPELPVILLTGVGTIADAVDAVKRGAYDYLTKPCDGAKLREVVGLAVASRARTQGPRSAPTVTQGTDALIGGSAAMVALRARIERVGRAQSPALVYGETGTGKELVARAIHACSTRRARPFITVNASAIPDTLLESELFGHARGAFTGAATSRHGLFAEADGGTLFLDEIGDLPLALQPKLLRVLQSGELRGVGADRARHVDVRIIAATHRRLDALVRAGGFREDLFYRLAVVTVEVPPLSARTEDIPELCAHLLDRARARAGSSPARSLSPALVEALAATKWPGNVRELESTIERLVVLATREQLVPEDLAGEPRHPNPRSYANDARTDPNLDCVIRDHVSQVLARVNGDKTEAAKLLGIDLSTLYRWQRKWRGS